MTTPPRSWWAGPQLGCECSVFFCRCEPWHQERTAIEGGGGEDSVPPLDIFTFLEHYKILQFWDLQIQKLCCHFFVWHTDSLFLVCFRFRNSGDPWVEVLARGPQWRLTPSGQACNHLYWPLASISTKSRLHMKTTGKNFSLLCLRFLLKLFF